jgi:hypothetical protein
VARGLVPRAAFRAGWVSVRRRRAMLMGVKVIGGLQVKQEIAVDDVRLDDTSFHPPHSQSDSVDVEAPIASGAAIAQRTPPPPDAKSTLATQINDAKAKRALIGARALATRLDDIERLTKLGIKVRSVFDLDNTVFDTRFRTLWCAQEFDRRNNTNYFSQLTEETIDMIGEDGRLTARHPALNLPDDVIEAFGKFWAREFWTPANLVHDRVIPEMLDIIREARSRGAECVFLTGRAEKFNFEGETIERSFRADTLKQLNDPPASLDVDTKQLFLKPTHKHKTAPYKEQMMRAWSEDGEIGFFITEGRRDIAHAKGLLPDLVCFLLQCSFEDDKEKLTNVPEIAGRW